MEVLELLRTRMRARKTTAEENLFSAANRLASGETIDHAAVESALVETGRTVEQFEELCDIARRRRALKADMDRGAAAQAKRDKSQATADRERAQFEKIHTAWMERAAELDAEIANHAGIVARAEAARGQLLDARNLPEPIRSNLTNVHALLAEAHDRLEQLQRAAKEQRENKERNEGFAEQHRKFNTTGTAGNADDYERLAKRAVRRLAELAPEIEAAQAAVSAAKSNVDAVEAAALKV